jgi:hypothetical protein
MDEVTMEQVFLRCSSFLPANHLHPTASYCLSLHHKICNSSDKAKIVLPLVIKSGDSSLTLYLANVCINVAHFSVFSNTDFCKKIYLPRTRF